MATTTQAQVITAEELKDHWQAHRLLTRRVIDGFPEDELFRFSIGGMRTFAELAREMIWMCGAGIHGIARDRWDTEDRSDDAAPRTKSELLGAWDRVTRDIDTLWPEIPPDRFRATATAFGQFDGHVWAHLFYFIDNEIHHRGQGYVYLRSLGIEPPPFWAR